MAASSPTSPITPTSSTPSPPPGSFDWWWTARFHSPNSTLDLSPTPSVVTPIYSSAWWQDLDFPHSPTSPTYTPANSPADSPGGYYPPPSSPAVDFAAAFSPMSPTWPPTYSPAAAYSSPGSPRYGSPNPLAAYCPCCAPAAYSPTSPAYGPCPAAYSPTSPNYGPEAFDVNSAGASRAAQRSLSYSYSPMSPGLAHRLSTAVYSPSSAWSAYCAAGFNDGGEGAAPADGGVEMAPTPPEPDYCYFCSTTLQDCHCQIGDDAAAAPAPAPAP